MQILTIIKRASEGVCRLLIPGVLGATTLPALAFPPAPHHTLYGIVRNEQGHPLGVNATVLMSSQGKVVYRGTVGKTAKPGANYTLRVPMDTGTLVDLYRPTAMNPAVAFTMTIVIGDNHYVPIEVQGDLPAMGDPSKSTRLDLTLGLDSDQDGLPDRWEQDLIGARDDDDVNSLGDVDPDGDFDKDGLSNLGEYIAGTYAFDRRDTLQLEVLDKSAEHVHLRFLVITGRTYQVKASLDGRDYTATRFSVGNAGASDQAYYQAGEVRYIDVYLPITADTKTELFQLHVR